MLFSLGCEDIACPVKTLLSHPLLWLGYEFSPQRDNIVAVLSGAKYFQK